jgi:hypothetical protein
MDGAVNRCPECGADVGLLRERWLLVHREGSAGYDYPPRGRRRCPGSLLQVVPLPGGDPGHGQGTDVTSFVSGEGRSV